MDFQAEVYVTLRGSLRASQSAAIVKLPRGYWAIFWWRQISFRSHLNSISRLNTVNFSLAESGIHSTGYIPVACQSLTYAHTRIDSRHSLDWKEAILMIINCERSDWPQVPRDLVASFVFGMKTIRNKIPPHKSTPTAKEHFLVIFVTWFASCRLS